MPDSQADGYLAKAKWADEKAAGAASAELAKQWRDVAQTYRRAASILQRAGTRTIRSQEQMRQTPGTA